MHFRSMILSSVATLALVSATAVHAADVNLTIYSKSTPGSVQPFLLQSLPGMDSYSASQQVPGYAVVREKREVDLPSARSEIKYQNVAAAIDPTTVTLKSITDPEGTSVLEQNFLYDLISREKMLERFIGQKISVEQPNNEGIETITGTLLSTQGGIVLEVDGGKIITLGAYSNIRFPELPGGLILKPTLMWDITTKKPGKHAVETTYQTGGLTWWADYNLIYSDGKDANHGFVDVNGWVSIVNRSGLTYDKAGLKLVAGDVNRATPQDNPYAMRAAKAMSMEADAAPGFAEKSFFEFHLYTLGRETTLPDNSTKQMELFPSVHKVPAEKELVFYGNEMMRYFGTTLTDKEYGSQQDAKVNVYLKFKNSKDNGMGMPLPAGRMRVNKQDDDNAVEFIGEDVIGHTPKDETVRIKMGAAFDVVGERKQESFSIDHNRRFMSETISINIRNHKEEDVTVLVRENLYRGANWQINEGAKYEKLDAGTIQFPVKVKAGKDETVRYAVTYSW